MTVMTETAPIISKHARFWDKIAKRYARTPIKDEATYQRKLAITRELMEPHMHVLEFGCGTGSTALLHAPYVDRILAIDVSARMIEIARNKAANEDIDNVYFEQADMEQFQANAEQFDMVLGLSILHLLDDRDTTIAQVYQVLKPGGTFISSTACLGDNLKFFKWIAPLGRWLGFLPLLRVFTSRQLLDSLTRQGFDIETHWSPGKNKGIFVVARKPE